MIKPFEEYLYEQLSYKERMSINILNKAKEFRKEIYNKRYQEIKKITDKFDPLFDEANKKEKLEPKKYDLTGIKSEEWKQLDKKRREEIDKIELHFDDILNNHKKDVQAELDKL